MQVCGGQMGEKDKQNSLSIVKGGGSGEVPARPTAEGHAWAYGTVQSRFHPSLAVACWRVGPASHWRRPSGKPTLHLFRAAQWS